MLLFSEQQTKAKAVRFPSVAGLYDVAAHVHSVLKAPLSALGPRRDGLEDSKDDRQRRHAAGTA